jgi:hypothetical protein
MLTLGLELLITLSELPFSELRGDLVDVHQSNSAIVRIVSEDMRNYNIVVEPTCSYVVRCPPSPSWYS